MSKSIIKVLVCFCIALFSSCESYVHNRVVDLKDSFILRVGMGNGGYGALKFTTFLKPSVGFCVAYPYVEIGKSAQRHERRDFVTTNEYMVISTFYKEKLWRSLEEPQHRTFGLPSLSEHSIDDEPWTESLDIQLSGTALIASAEVGASPIEILDFFLGFLNIDFVGDDLDHDPDDDKGSFTDWIFFWRSSDEEENFDDQDPYQAFE